MSGTSLTQKTFDAIFGEPDPKQFSVSPSLQAAVETMSRSSAEDRGAIFTREGVVWLILDLVGYTVDRPLYEQRLLEPSFGGGEFLLEAIDRLLTSWMTWPISRAFPLESLSSCRSRR